MQKSILRSQMLMGGIPSSPILRYTDVKDIKIFVATFNYDVYKDRYKHVASLYVPQQVLFRNNRMKWITLEDALILYREAPTLYSNPNTLRHLYSYIGLYDKELIEKLVNRNNKFRHKKIRIWDGIKY